MDKNFVIGFIKFLMSYFSITPTDLGIQLTQKYRPIPYGGLLEVDVPNQKSVNGWFIGALKRPLVPKTPVNTQLDPSNRIMIVDNEAINVDRKYFICVEQ